MKGGSNMALFAIGDLHLGFGVNKTMDKFGEEWKNHIQKIEKNWRECIQQQDTVLLLGDISWGMTIEQTKPDFDFIETLPGKKICICGTHLDEGTAACDKVKELIAFFAAAIYKHDY